MTQEKMVKEKITFEQFLATVEGSNKPYIQGLHEYFLENGCKATFEEKKNGMLASYKHTKLKKVFANFLFRKQGMLVRIYGENIGKYPGFVNDLPQEMVQSIQKSGDCKRLINNTCSPKCTGYDFIIKGEHFQKCRYNCFEFLITEESKPYIKSFIENEVKERTAV